MTTKVKEITDEEIGQSVKIVEAEDKNIIGKTGNLTTPFGVWDIEKYLIGVFLDEPIKNSNDIVNLTAEDVVEFLN